MTSSTLRTIADGLYAVARDCLANDGYVAPQHFMVSGNGGLAPITFVRLPEDTDEAKALIADALKQLAPRVSAIATVHETWMAFGKDEERRVSERADRGEAILVIVQSRNGTWTLISPFKRDETGRPLRPEDLTAEWIPLGSHKISGSLFELY